MCIPAPPDQKRVVQLGPHMITNLVEERRLAKASGSSDKTMLEEMGKKTSPSHVLQTKEKEDT
jgi:hypothetical protein